jgi:hypothetical protein
MTHDQITNVSRKNAKAQRKNELNHKEHEGHKESFKRLKTHSSCFVIFVFFVVNEFVSFAPLREISLLVIAKPIRTIYYTG